MKTIVPRAAVALAALAVSWPIVAQTPPARRPGQWEVRQGPAGGPMGPPIRICMSAADASGEFRGLNSGPASKCEYKRISASAAEVRWRNVCRGQGDTLTMEGHAYDIAPGAFKVDMKMSGLGDAGTVHAEARWLSATCADSK